MNELIVQQNSLPTNIEDLSKFVLIGREKLVSVRAEIRAIDKLKLANEVKEQKLQEAQNIAEIVLDAETKIGELLKAIPKSSGGDRKSNEIKKSSNALFETPKQLAKQEIGISNDQAKRYIKLAENKPLVEQAKAEARENGEIVTRQAVIDKTKKERCNEYINNLIKESDKKIDAEYHSANKVAKLVNSGFGENVTEEELDCYLEYYDDPIEEHIDRILTTKRLLEKIEHMLQMRQKIRRVK